MPRPSKAINTKSYLYGFETCKESPVESELKTLPRGNGDWPGFDYVYRQIANACDAMGKIPHIALSDEHVHAMAVLGCGHEETMKAEMWRLRNRKFI